MTMRSWPFLAMSILAACSNDMTVYVRGGDRPPNPDFLFRSGGVAASSGLKVKGDVTVTRFQIVLRSMRLQEAPTSGVDGPGAQYFGPGPYLLDMPAASLAGGALTELIPKYVVGPKSYYEMDFVLQAVSPGDVALEPALGPLQGKTFRITGTNAKGVSFTFESSVTRELVRPSVYRLGTNHNNLVVNVAPDRWFALPDGTALDPTDPAAQQQIEENVAASIDAYEDDNMDGIPDPLA
ncbi:MAG: hypothetical protein ACJ79P_04015 [Myxococcales bacterium]